MKLGLSSYTYTWSIGMPGYSPAHPMTALDLLNQAHDMGICVVQIADNLPLDRISDAKLDEIAGCAAKWGIQIEVGTRGIDPGHLRKYLALARQFASPILRVVIDTASHHPSLDETILLLQPLQAEFEDAGVILAIENHERFQVAELAQMVRRLGDWTGICLDTVNSFGALEGSRVVVEALGPLAVNLHFKDFTVSRASHMMGFTLEGCPAGQGRLDATWLFAALKGFGRDCNVILELWTPPENTLEATIAKEQRWAGESITYLRNFIPE